ncbi:MAG: diguanylate cyclase, partial [Desulfuromonadales bacterium]|nr:diguanylate cyclase [Desulfuromonadales bacterium]
DTLPVPAGRELAELVESFNSMSGGLRRHHDSLEQTIQDRTAQLQEANQALNDDIEMRKGIERTLEQLRHRNEMILDTTNEGILGLDPAGRISFFNRAAGTLTGLAEEHINRVKVQDLLGRLTMAQEQAKPGELINEILSNGTQLDHQEGLFTRLDGETFPIEYSCAPLLGNGITGAVFSFSDITERKRSEQEIQKLAFYDQLTGLPNRTLFYDRITQRVAQVERDKQKLALMFLDLDDFKMVNDTLGHAAGDDFLREVARRLRAGSRQADTVARLGGDEFVWFGEIIDEDDARLIAQKFLEGIARPVGLGEYNFSSTVSIGIALFPDVAQDVAGLMKCADTAMYSVKQKSKNAFCFFHKLRGS